METLDRLDQLILLELEDKESMGDEIDASEGIQSTLREKIIEIEIIRPENRLCQPAQVRVNNKVLFVEVK